MKAQCVTLSPEQVMAVAPDVRYRVKEAVTPKRQFPSKPDQPGASGTTNLYRTDEDESQPFAHIEELDDTLPTDPDSLRTMALQDGNKSMRGVIIPDSFEQYLQNLPPDEIPRHFTVARDAFSLRSIQVRVNFIDNIDAVLDNGSSVISMSEAAAKHCLLSYDPTIFMTMESANGGLDRTLGLAKNVPCKISGISVFFQIHIVRSPAYDMLIGRPFDVLTRSTVQNFGDGTQNVTLYDPNSSQVCTVPTYPRRNPRFVIPRNPKPSVSEELEENFRK